MTTHRRTVLAFLRNTLLSTNRIESILSLVEQRERNITCSSGSAMRQWLRTVLFSWSNRSIA
ncbi:MAG: hypothetical protein ABI988_07750 [Nitrospirota bacterium]